MHLGLFLVNIDVCATDPAAAEQWFTISLVPTTLELTTLGRRGPGDTVNLRVGAALALSNELSLNFGWDAQFGLETRVEDRDVPGTSFTTSNFLFGFSYAVTRSVAVDLKSLVGAGSGLSVASRSFVVVGHAPAGRRARVVQRVSRRSAGRRLVVDVAWIAAHERQEGAVAVCRVSVGDAIALEPVTVLVDHRLVQGGVGLGPLDDSLGGGAREPRPIIADEAVEMTVYEDFVSEQVLEGKSILGLYPATDDWVAGALREWRQKKGR